MIRADKRIVLLNDVHGDFPIANHVVAPAGIYDAYVNPHGAVAVIATNGEWLGIKPGEFQWLDSE